MVNVRYKNNQYVHAIKFCYQIMTYVNIVVTFVHNISIMKCAVLMLVNILQSRKMAQKNEKKRVAED